MSEHSIYDNYRTYKKELKLEDYIKQQPLRVRKVLCKFKSSNHRLDIEVGKHFNRHS